MEDIEAEIEEKKIEREASQPVATPQVQDKVVEKPKRARSQKQIEAFEKARAKRAGNLKKKREEEEAMMADASAPDEAPQNKIEKPKPKRGRPRKSKMKREEPPAQQFIQPPQLPQHYQLPYPVQGQHYYPPPHYHQGFPAPMPQPVNNYYYYGAPPTQEEPKVEKKVQFEPEPQPEPQPLPPDPQLYQPEEESEDEVELPPDPRMKYRFA